MCVHLCRLLNTAQGSLLDDEQLVNTLQSSKTTSMEVTEQLEISEQTEVKIDTAREVLKIITASNSFVNFSFRDIVLVLKELLYCSLL